MGLSALTSFLKSREKTLSLNSSGIPMPRSVTVTRAYFLPSRSANVSTTSILNQLVLVVLDRVREEVVDDLIEEASAMIHTSLSGMVSLISIFFERYALLASDDTWRIDFVRLQGTSSRAADSSIWADLRTFLTRWDMPLAAS